MSVRKTLDFASLRLLVKRSKLLVLHGWPLRLAAGKLGSQAEEAAVQTRPAATLTLRSCPHDSSSLVLSWTPVSHGHIPPVSKSADCLLMCPQKCPCLYHLMWFQQYLQTPMFCGVCSEKKITVDAPEWKVISSSQPWRFRISSAISGCHSWQLLLFILSDIHMG